MPLNNFGAILTFAEKCEIRLQGTYSDFSGAAVLAEHGTLFGQLAEEGHKFIREIQRTRRENVTEMILENVHGFSREAYRIKPVDIKSDNAAAALKSACGLEEKIRAYYLDAAVKLKALSEVSRALKMLAKKHARRLQTLEEL